MTTQTFTDTLFVTVCPTCSVTFGITQAVYNARRNDHQWFYCPAGHAQRYSVKSELEVERQRRIRAEAGRAQAEDAYEMERRSKIALKGHLTRARNKIAAGVCPAPDCGQHFANVREHMRHRHPDWHLTDPDTGEEVLLD